MQSVESDGLKKLDSDLKELLDDMPELRRELHEELASELKKALDAQITGAGMTSGMIQGWQQPHVGSRGGYAAIRAIGSKERASTGRESPGAITNYLESGHKIRSPKGGKDYRPRIHVARVSRKHFYQATESAFEAKALSIAGKFVETVAKRLEGE